MSRTILLGALGAVILFAAVPAHPKLDSGPSPWCGTRVTSLEEALARHDYMERRRAREARAEGDFETVRATTPNFRKAKGLAVIEDDGSLVSEPNQVDVLNTALDFRRAGKRIRILGSGAGINSDFGAPVDIGDDDTVVLDLPFAFRFYGKRYRRAFLNSDGNITFGEADNESTARDVSRTLTGPPRIMAFFSDLDPSVLAAGGVYVRQTPGFVRITWDEVPEFGTNNLNTFQVTLFPSGRILLALGQVWFQADAIIGTSPGGVASLELVDLSEEVPTAPTGSAVLERFTGQRLVDDVALSKALLENLRDDYDHLVVWLDFPASLGSAFAFEINVSNQIEGIGLPIFDSSQLFGSDGRLESYVQMGRITQYPDNPREVFLGENDTFGILGQETGHRWLAFNRVCTSGGGGGCSGPITRDLLGRGFGHWSFYLDSDSSVMEGNDIRDNGDGTFTTVGAVSQFSPLDRYMMGLIPPDAVPPFFLVTDADLGNRSAAPDIGVTFSGNRQDYTVDDIIAAEGARVPAAGNAPKKFKMAFVVVGQAGQTVSQASINKVAKIKNQWRQVFRKFTGGKGKANVKIRLKK